MLIDCNFLFHAAFFFFADNLWECSPDLMWMYQWSKPLLSKLNPSAKEAFESATCMSNVALDVIQKPSPLLTVMKYYEERVLPSCRDGCNCQITFLSKTAINYRITYSVHVSCVGLNLKHFPKMPEGTTTVVLSNNKVCIPLKTFH